MQKSIRSGLVATAFVIGLAASGDYARAADMPVKAPPRTVVAVFSWTGFYAGVNAGYGWGRQTVDYAPGDPTVAGLMSFNGPVFGGTPPGPASVDPNGGFGGVQAGYNWQVNRVVVGVEVDFQGADIRGRGVSPFLFTPLTQPNPGANVFADQHVRWFGTVRGRIGFTPVDKLLLYATGGFAYAGIKEDQSITFSTGSNSSGFGFGFLCTSGVTCFQGSSSRTATGGTVGAGAEYALTKNLTVKAEYLFMSLDGDTTRVTALRIGGAIGHTNAPSSVIANYGRLDLNIVRVGLNYKFDGFAR